MVKVQPGYLCVFLFARISDLGLIIREIYALTGSIDIFELSRETTIMANGSTRKKGIFNKKDLENNT